MSDAPQTPDWWKASDGKWYPPEQHPDYGKPPPQTPAAQQVPAPQVASHSAPRYEYYTEVNKKSVNMRWLAGNLNAKAAQGWRLHTALEQAGNTITIFERQIG